MHRRANPVLGLLIEIISLLLVITELAATLARCSRRASTIRPPDRHEAEARRPEIADS